MNSWVVKVKDRLTPLSVENHNVKAMIAEWFYNGSTIDLEFPSEDCELCGHPGIRYQFGISNKHNGNQLLVGSECITRFDLTGIGENGEYLDSQTTKKKVSKDRSKLIKEARLKRVLNCLIQLKNADNRFELDSSIEKFQERGAFSPKHAAFLFSRMKRLKISFRPKDFKISLRRNREKKQLGELQGWQKELIAPALTPSQIKIILERFKNI